MAEQLTRGVIGDVIEEIRDRKRMREGIEACAQREADFSGKLEMELAGIAMVPEARDYMTQQLTEFWRSPVDLPSTVQREVIIGGGYHAAVYCASRVRAGFPRPVVLERNGPEEVGGTFAMSMRPVFRLNSRSRPGPAGLPDQDKALNFIPGGIIQPAMVSSEEYPTNANMAWAIRLTLAQFADVYCGVAVTGIGGSGNGTSTSPYRVTVKTPMGELKCGRLLDARGCGDPADKGDGNRILDFGQLMKRMGSLFPLRGMRQVAIIGGGDSGRCAAESLLGIAPGNSSAIGLDYVTRADWYLSGDLSEATCSEFRKSQRGRYVRLAQYLKGNKSNPSTRLRILAANGSRPAAIPDGVLMDSRTYDMAILATGCRREEIPDPFAYEGIRLGNGTGSPVAVQARPYPAYKIGPAANLPFSSPEISSGVSAIPANSVAMFRLGPRTAALASTLPAPDISA